MAGEDTRQASNQASGEAEADCPTSPVPSDFTYPKAVGEGYYSRLSPSLLEPIRGAKERLFAEADMRHILSHANATAVYQTAKNTFDNVQRTFDSQKRIMTIRYQENKKQIKLTYRNTLRDAATKRNTSDIDIENDELVPQDKKAIAQATFNVKLALDDQEYLVKLAEQQRILSTAQNELKLAQEQCALSRFSADFQKAVDERQAELALRNDVSKALNGPDK